MFTKSDIYIFLILFCLLVFEILLKISDIFNWFQLVSFLIFFIIFLIWLVVLTYNLSTLAIDYAYPDEIQMKSGARRRRLIRFIILICCIGVLYILTIFFVDYASGKFLDIISWTLLALIMNIYSLRLAFLLLGPEENPYFLYKQRG